MSVQTRIFVYDWYVDNWRTGTRIQIFGLTTHSEPCCLIITDYFPEIFLEPKMHVQTPSPWSRPEILQRVRQRLFPQCIADQDLLGENKWDTIQRLREMPPATTPFGVPCIATSQRPAGLQWMALPKLYADGFDANGQQIPTGMYACRVTSLMGMYRTTAALASMDLGNDLGIALDGTQFILHEHTISASQQLANERNLPTAGWITFHGRPNPGKKITFCSQEYYVSWRSLAPDTQAPPSTPIRPTILSFDIETNSENPKAIPRASNPLDEIFQISAVVQTSDRDVYRSIFTRGTPDLVLVDGEPMEDMELSGETRGWMEQIRSDMKQYYSLMVFGDTLERGGDHQIGVPHGMVRNRTIVWSCESEVQLLTFFAAYVQSVNPTTITGYNIFSFDLPYFMDRAKFRGIAKRVLQMSMRCNFNCEEYVPPRNEGMDSNGGRENEDDEDEVDTGRGTSGSSKHWMRANERYLQTPGRVWLDVMQLVMRDFKLDSYRLDTVARHFLQAQKDPISYQDVFASFRTGVLSPTPSGIELLSRVAKYCIVDAALVLELFEKLDMWIGTLELACVVCVPPSSVFRHGQQSKMFAQVSRYCRHTHPRIIIENTQARTFPSMKYQGASVLAPVPGFYEDVLSFDFNSLYPSIIVAYNIDYTTLVPETDTTIPDSECHIIAWEQHVHCAHTLEEKLDSDKYCCTSYRFRFLKSPPGVLPTIIQNLLRQRADTRAQMKRLDRTTVEGKFQYTILDKRQLSYKISANSMYGATGVRSGKLPLLAGAMSVTAVGRQSLQQAANYLQVVHGAVLRYGDTDSNYVQFPHIPTAQLWDHATRIDQQMFEDRIFPAPMRLAFEQEVYGQYLILSKKRYLWKNRDRTTLAIEPKLGKKGVALSRRDNAVLTRELYQYTVEAIFAKRTCDAILTHIQDRILAGFHRTLPQSMYITTKSVKDESQYKIRALSDDVKKRTKRLLDLKCTVETYDKRALPAHVRLAALMRSRGVRVDPGQRIEYVIIDTFTLDEIMEDAEYQARHADVLPINVLYYARVLCKPIDELLQVSFGVEKAWTRIYEQFCRKGKLVHQLRQMYQTRLELKQSRDIREYFRTPTAPAVKKRKKMSGS